MIGQGELRTPHAAREHKQKLYVPPSGDIINIEILYKKCQIKAIIKGIKWHHDQKNHYIWWLGDK